MRETIWTLNPSDFAFLWEECKRCFWLKVTRDFRRPQIPMAKIFTVIDEEMRKHFAGRRTGDVLPALPSGVLDTQEHWVESVPLPIPGSPRVASSEAGSTAWFASTTAAPRSSISKPRSARPPTFRSMDASSIPTPSLLKTHRQTSLVSGPLRALALSSLTRIASKKMPPAAHSSSVASPGLRSKRTTPLFSRF